MPALSAGTRVYVCMHACVSANSVLSTPSNNYQLAIITVRTHVYTSMRAWIGCITCNHHIMSS